MTVLLLRLRYFFLRVHWRRGLGIRLLRRGLCMTVAVADFVAETGFSLSSKRERFGGEHLLQLNAIAARFLE